MATDISIRETLDDLYCVEGKAELIAGRIIHFMPSGELPSSAAFEIAVSLRAYSKKTGHGKAYADGVGYAVAELPSGRESFSPDASYYDGPPPANPMRFITGVPKFAAEVRSENDYGPTAELEMAEKRSDYFAAGTVVVWDVDPEAKTIAMYTATARPKRFFSTKATSPTPSLRCQAGEWRWRMYLANDVMQLKVPTDLHMEQVEYNA